jgi:hypothetical protein
MDRTREDFMRQSRQLVVAILRFQCELISCIVLLENGIIGVIKLELFMHHHGWMAFMKTML